MNYFRKKPFTFVPKAQGGLNIGTLSKFGNTSNWDKMAKSGDKLWKNIQGYTGVLSSGEGDGGSGASTKKSGIFGNMDETSRNKMLGSAMTAGANMISSLNPNNDIQPGDSQRANKSLEFSKKTGLKQGLGAALDVAGTFNPAIAAASGAVKLGAALGDFVDRKDEYGVSKSKVGKVAGNILNPLGNIQDAFNAGKKGGFGAGLKSFFTYGASYEKDKAGLRDRALGYDRWEEAQATQGTNKGSNMNTSVYALNGAYIKKKKSGGIINPPSDSRKEGDVEVENGEIILGNPRSIEINSPNAKAELVSNYGMIVKGDKHNSDTDNDGKEGIRLTPEGNAYVASNYLTVEGKRARSGQKTVADEMKPYVKFLHKSESESSNPYLSNSFMKAEAQHQLDKIRKKAESNKFKENLKKETKNGSVSSVISFIADNAPMNDLDEKDKAAIKNLIMSRQLTKGLGLQ